MEKQNQNEWESHYQKNGGRLYPEIPIVSFIGRNYFKLDDRKKIKVLDLGSGKGNHTLFLAKEGFDTHAIDFSKTAIEKTQARLDQENLSATLYIQDMIDLPFKDKELDVVIDATSIQHNPLNQIETIISEIHRCLNNNGRYFGMFAAEHRNSVVQNFQTHFFKKNELRDQFKQFNNVLVDYSEYTTGNGENYIKFWHIEAHK